MEFLIILLLIALNGVFSMSEIAIVSARKTRLQTAAKAGRMGAATALGLSQSPERFLSTVQIGITLIGLLTGIYSGENITDQLEDYLNGFPYFRPIADGLAVTIVLLATTFLTVILGELVPKRIGLANPEAISMKIAPAMRMLSRLAYPFVWIFTRTSDMFLRVFNLNSRQDVNITEAEIKEAVREATTTGEIRKIEQDIVERVFILGDRKVSSLMTPRRDVTYINSDDDWPKVRSIVRNDLHSFYPVYEKDRENIIGVVSLKDLFLAAEAESLDLKRYVTPAHFLSENTSAFNALERFKAIKVSYALIFNEYGSVVGMISVNDILLALVGHASDFQNEEYEMKQVSDDSWLVDGQYPLTEFLLNFNLLPEPTFTRILTVAGLILELLRRVPQTGESVVWKSLRMEVIEMDGVKIDKVLVKLDRLTDSGSA